MDNLQFHTGGFLLETETLDFLQEQSKLVMALSALGGSDTYILSGVKIEAANVTDGIIVYDGEVIPFKGGAAAAQVSIYETTENVIYQEDADNDGAGDSKAAYSRREARFGTGGVVTFDFSDLKPFVEGIGGQIFKTFFKDVRLPYIGAIADIPTGWELCEILSGKFPVIYDPNNPDYDSIGAEGGADEVALTEAEMPQHNHNGNAAQAGDHSHTGTAASAGGHSHTGTTGSAGSHKHTGSTNSGGSHSHPYRDAYFAEQHASNGYDGVESLSKNVLGSASSDFDNRYLHYRNRTTSSAGSHTHSFNMNNAGSHTHSLNLSTEGAHQHSVTTDTAGGHSHAVTTENKGSGQAHENRPSYKVIALIKYVG